MLFFKGCREEDSVDEMEGELSEDEKLILEQMLVLGSLRGSKVSMTTKMCNLGMQRKQFEKMVRERRRGRR